MKKNNNKKGFTIVELVIVIAVIAILAAVLIPTFSNVIDKANDSAALQRATNAYKEAYALALSDGKIVANETAEAQGFTFKFSADNSAAAEATVLPAGYTYTVRVDANGKVTVN